MSFTADMYLLRTYAQTSQPFNHKSLQRLKGLLSIRAIHRELNCLDVRALFPTIIDPLRLY
jgi:hypothetical protein